MDYKVMIYSLVNKLDTPVENWKAFNNNYFELEKTHGMKQPFNKIPNLIEIKNKIIKLLWT